MHAAWFSIGFVAVTACSIDHVVVATLEATSATDSRAGGAGGAVAGSAGMAGAVANASSGGAVASGDSGDSKPGRAASASGGSAGNGVLPNPAGAGGTASRLLCSCLEQQAELCGSDGITYPTECSDAGPCFPPAVACWHACPCLGAELDGGSEITSTPRWFSSDCASVISCVGDLVCMTFSDVDLDAQTICASAN